MSRALSKFITDKTISRNIPKSNIRAAKLNHPRDYKKVMFEEIPVKLQFVALVVAVQHIFSLDFLEFWQYPRKFQKHRWLHTSRMHCNVCLLVKPELTNLPRILAYEFHRFKIYYFISVSQTQLGDNANNHNSCWKLSPGR